MSESVPTTPSATLPATRHAAFLTHARAWFARDVEPEMDDLKAVAAKVRELTPELARIANAVAVLAKAVPAGTPGDAALIADAVKAAEVVARIAAEIAASGM